MPIAGGQIAVVAGADGLIYAIGGYDGATALSTVVAYNSRTDRWTPKTPLPNATRGAAVAEGPNGVIYVIGGGTADVYMSMVQAYNASSDTWSLRTPLPAATWMASAAIGDDGKIYVVGGESPDYDFYSNRTQIYDPSTDSWTDGTAMPTGRSMLGVVKGPDGLIYAMGGYNTTALSVVEAYDPSTDTWTEKTPMPSPRLEFGLTLGPDGRIYVIGGGTSYSNNEAPFFSTVEIYDPTADTWIIPSWSESKMPTARKELGAALGNNGRIYAVGGTNGTYLNTNEEALIVLPENIPPTAYVDTVTPNPATRGQTVYFVGHGTDPDGSVVGYEWRSSIDGAIGTTATFSLATLSEGTHTIYFSVQDDAESWSDEATVVVMVKPPVTEDPLYEALSNRTDSLSQQNANLRETVDSLSWRLDLMMWALLGMSVVTIALIVLFVVAPVATKILRKGRSSNP